MNVFEKETQPEGSIRPWIHEDDQIDQLPTIRVQALSVAQNWDEEDYWSIDKMATWIMPAISIPYATDTVAKSHGGIMGVAGSAEGQLALLRNLVKSSGIYALASVAPPLIALALAPFLTHNLSPSEYGVLTILTTLIGLGAGITQLGLGSAFFRAYSYDFPSTYERKQVLATVTALLSMTSVPVALIVFLLSPLLASLFFGYASFAGDMALAGVVILLQNLTIPGFAWLRAENRPVFYSLLSICNLLITLVVSIVLVGFVHLGVAGSLIATGCGYACVVLCMMPIIVARAGVRIRTDIARSVLTFGVPQVFSFVSYWVLQLSDRYLLSVFGSLEQTAKYSVVYTLGSAMSVLVLSPFTLAWPSVMFTIARRDDAQRLFQLVFRWFSLFLLFSTFLLSLVATLLLDTLFPVAYHSSASIIPFVALSNALYGIYIVFSIGANIKRKTWLAAIFSAIAALVNVLLNLLLLPHYQAMGAAISTLLAYIILALVTLIVNQRLYFIRFELGLFALALLIGCAVYVGNALLVRQFALYQAWELSLCSLCLYTGVLFLLGKLWGKRFPTRIP